MTVFERPDHPWDDAALGAGDGLCPEPALEAGALGAASAAAAGAAGCAEEAGIAAALERAAAAAWTAETPPLVIDDLLPDVEASERERRREQRLVEAACRGDGSAIEALYRSHFDTIFRYVFLRLGSPSVAEDVTSQVFLGMLRGLRRYQDQGKPFIAWLYGIAQKQVALYQRGRHRAPSLVDLDAAAELAAQTAGPFATAAERETRTDVARALAKVPEGQREVLMLRYILSLSIAETAAIVGRSEGAVKQLQLRGLSTLKSILGWESATA